MFVNVSISVNMSDKPAYLKNMMEKANIYFLANCWVNYTPPHLLWAIYKMSMYFSDKLAILPVSLQYNTFTVNNIKSLYSIEKKNI